jgi:hypothetical protein
MKAKTAGWLGPLGGVLAVLVPKGICPVCIATSGSVLSTLGLSFLADDAIMRWLLAGILLVALLAFFVRARNKERWGLFWTAVAGSVLVYAGWLLSSSIILYSGTALLSAAAILNLRRPREEAPLPVSTARGTSS